MKGTIQLKINCALILMITIILSCFGVYDYFALRSKLSQELSQSADRIAERLSAGMVGPLWDMDEKRAEDIGRQEMANEKVFAVLVREGDQRDLFHGAIRNEAWEAVKTADAAISGSHIASSKEIMKEKQKLGTVEVYVSTRFMDQELKGSLVGITLRTLLLDICIVILMFFFIRRIVILPVSRVSAGLAECAESVATAADQIFSVGRDSADGASEQAASLSQTFVSLGEVSSMARDNAEHADNANQFVKEVGLVVEQARMSMSQLSSSIEEIKDAGEETFKIIKTIDEIAFQTNMLALNAAIEAARAGEAGLAFAVVADEVRNLSMRAAKAAQNTASIIKGTVMKVTRGSDLVGEAYDLFNTIAERNRQMDELISEIASASDKQARSIEHSVNACAQMENVVQRNVSRAGETANASEEMNRRAGQLKDLVGKLAALIGNSHNDSSYGTPQEPETVECTVVEQFTSASSQVRKLSHNA